jgi:hypothetical protein
MRPIRFTTLSGQTSAPVPLDVRLTPFSVTVTCIPTTGNATLEYTSDDVWAPTYTPASGTWQPLPAMTNQATTKDVSFTSPITAIRIVAAGGGSVVTQVVQAGL